MPAESQIQLVSLISWSLVVLPHKVFPFLLPPGKIWGLVSGNYYAGPNWETLHQGEGSTEKQTKCFFKKLIHLYKYWHQASQHSGMFLKGQILLRGGLTLWPYFLTWKLQQFKSSVARSRLIQKSRSLGFVCEVGVQSSLTENRDELQELPPCKRTGDSGVVLSGHEMLFGSS